MKSYKFLIYVYTVSIFFIIVAHYLKPRKIHFDVADITISRDHNPTDTVPMKYVILSSIVCPLAYFFFDFRSCFLDYEMELFFYLTFFASHVFLTAFVEIIKRAVGRLRPDFLARCLPVGNICTGDTKIVNEGRKSFPSGHSAMAACGFSFVVFCINSQYFKSSVMQLHMNRYTKLLASFLCTLPVLIIAINRHTDNKHHVSDILSGLMIGFITSMLFFKYFGNQHNLEIGAKTLLLDKN